ncbi:MAG TPA: ABC transporter permease, partial [Phycisphaerae bacterium]|nr:ABC transporter permease [Phycisphaerae bacterium]
MRHWSLVGIRNWSAKPGRTAAALAAIALGVGVVVWVTCAYESVRLALTDQVWFWIGRSHLAVESVYGNEGTVYQEIAEQLARDRNVAAVTYRLTHRVVLHPLATESKPPATRPPRLETDELLAPRDDIVPEDWIPPGSDVTESSREPAVLTPRDPIELAGTEIQAVGIDPNTEYAFRSYDDERIAGRKLQPDDTDAAVLDRRLAEAHGIQIGDKIRLRRRITAEDVNAEAATATFQVVGLLERRQVAKQQLPVVLVKLEELQRLVGYDQHPRRVTKIDLQLKDTSSSAIRSTEQRVWNIVNQHRQGFLVSSSEAKLKQVEAAERQSGFVLLLVSCVALFTAFFIILSTLSIGMLERIGQLGTLRCLGVTRLQMAAMVLLMCASSAPSRS